MELSPSKSSWDSAQSAAKLILGLFLFVGLFSSLRYGVNQFLFLQKSSQLNTPTKINLIETPDVSISKGYFEITGYAGAPLEYTYYDPGNTGSRTFFYYPLSATTSTASNPKILVEHGESQHFFLSPKVSSLPPEHSQVSVRGIIGISGIPRELSSHFVTSSPLLLVAEATPPKMSTLLLWFIPTLLAFLLGIFFILQWLFKVKKYFF